MKQVNVLMDEKVLEHLEKFAQMTSLLFGSKVTTSDIIRWAVEDYSKYGQFMMEAKLLNNRPCIDVISTDSKKNVKIVVTSDNAEKDQRLAVYVE